MICRWPWPWSDLSPQGPFDVDDCLAPMSRGLALTDFLTSLQLILEGLRSSSDADLASLVHLNSLLLHEAPNGEQRRFSQ